MKEFLCGKMPESKLTTLSEMMQLYCEIGANYTIHAEETEAGSDLNL